MKIKFLGTAAYEGVPAISCNCEVCKQSRALGGRNLRTRSQAFIDDKILLDFPPDSFCHFLYNDIDLCKVNYCLITHSHSDHLYCEDFNAFKFGPYTQYKRETPFCLYGARTSATNIINSYNKDDLNGQLKVEVVEPFVEFSFEGYNILPVDGKHLKDTLLYRIEKDGKSLFYAHDTGFLSQDSLSALEAKGRLDLISIDCTIKACSEKSNHLSYEGVLETLKILKSRKVVDEKTIVVVNHFSHNNGYTYESLSKIAEKDNIIVSYDGLEINF